MFDDDDNNDNDNDLVFVGNNHLGWMHSWQRGGWVGDFYDDDNNEDYNNGDNSGNDAEDVFELDV